MPTNPTAAPPTAAAVSRNAAFQAILNDPAKPLASLAVLSIRNGQVAYSGGFGFARMGSAGAKPAPDALAGADTLYRIASISKTLTTLGVMRLVERGVLDLDADVGHYLGWGLRNPAFPYLSISLRMLLTHTSGLRDDAGYFWPEGTNLREVLTPGGKLFDKGQAWSNRAMPGQFFQYANLPWGVIGTVMECATKMRFDRLMHQELFAPLGIDGGFNPAELPPEQLARLATLYRKRTEVSGREIWNPQGPWVPQVDDYSAAAPVNRATAAYVVGSNGLLFGPQGNARASAVGLGVVAQTLMNDGTAPNGQRYLKPETVKLMLSRQWTYSTPDKGDNYEGLMLAWGLGNQHFTDVSGKDSKGKPTGDRLIAKGGYKGYGHLGNAWGLTSAMVFNPEAKSAMVYLIGGPGFNPDAADPGQFSSFYGYEERILTALGETV
jgi:CubicO group peptidase (beta-lactamase class C family)